MSLNTEHDHQKTNRSIHRSIKLSSLTKEIVCPKNWSKAMFSKTVVSKLPIDFESISDHEKQETIKSAHNAAVIEWESRTRTQYIDSSSYYFKIEAIPEKISQMWNNIRLSKDYSSINSHISVWNDVTAGIMFETFRAFMGFLVKKDSTTEVIPGLGLSLDKITILDFVNPTYIKLFAEFLKNRSGKFTSTIDHYIKLVKYLLNPEDGWLINNSEILYLTDAVPGNLFHEMARQEYVRSKMTDIRILTDSKYRKEITNLDRKELSVCRELSLSEIRLYSQLGAYAFCSTMTKEVKAIHDKIRSKYSDTYGRDPFLPIEGLIQMDNPLKVLTIALERESIEIRKMLASELSASDIRHIQRHLLISMLTIFPLRAKQWQSMTYMHGNTGHLRTKPQGGHMIVIPIKEIKNGASIQRKSKISTLEVNLDNQNLENFNYILDFYLKNILPYYKEVNKRNFLFPSIKGNGIDPYTDTVSWVNGVLLPICSELGIKNVSTFGCHAFRHLGATNVLRLTGKMEEAAYFLLDDYKTTERCYARLRIEKAVNRIVDLVINDRFRLS